LRFCLVKKAVLFVACAVYLPEIVREAIHDNKKDTSI